MDDDPTIRFTDEEATFLRHARFGELPARIPPDDRLPLTETEGPRALPDHLGDSREWTYRHTAGGL